MEGTWSIAVALDAHPASLRAGGEVSWRLTVSNRSAESLSLTFPTAQLGELILEKEGTVRHRWSDGQMFAQVVTERRLEPGETWTIVLDDRLDVEPGAYEAVGVVTCSPQLPPVRVIMAVDARS